MSIIDALLEFSDAQAVTSVGANVSTNITKLANAGINVGAGTPLWVVVQVNNNVDFDSAGAATLAISFETDNVKSFDSRTQLWTTPALALAALTAGTVLVSMPIPYEATEQWIGLVYTVGTAVMTQGALDAWVSLSPPSRFDS